MALVLQEVINIPFHYTEAHVTLISSSKNTGQQEVIDTGQQKVRFTNKLGGRFSKKRRNAIKRHKQNLEQGKDLTDSEKKIEDQAARKSPANFPLQFSLPCL